MILRDDKKQIDHKILLYSIYLFISFRPAGGTNVAQSVVEPAAECKQTLTRRSSRQTDGNSGCYKSFIFVFCLTDTIAFAFLGALVVELRVYFAFSCLVPLQLFQYQNSSTSLFTTILVCSDDVVYFQTQATLSECYVHPTTGTFFWTAGQRIDPSRESAFVWRVTSTDTYSDRVSVMTYTNWQGGQPNYYNQAQSCVLLMEGRSYRWNDAPCSTAYCSVCELDL